MTNVFYVYIGLDKDADFVLAPAGVSGNVPYMNLLRKLYAVFMLLLVHENYFPVVMSFMISIVLASKFRNLTIRLRRVVDGRTSNRVDDVELDNIRLRHHFLCHLVERTDYFMRIHNIGSLIAVPIIDNHRTSVQSHHFR